MQLLQADTLMKLDQACALQVRWWCIMMPYLVGRRNRFELPEGPVKQALAAFLSMYTGAHGTLTAADVQLEVQVMLCQALHHLPHLFSQAERSALQDLVTAAAKCKVSAPA